MLLMHINFYKKQATYSVGIIRSEDWYLPCKGSFLQSVLLISKDQSHLTNHSATSSHGVHNILQWR